LTKKLSLTANSHCLQKNEKESVQKAHTLQSPEKSGNIYILL